MSQDREKLYFGYLICDVANLWRRMLSIASKQYNLTGVSRRALCTIAYHPGLTQIQLATELELEPQNLVRILDQLNENDWIEKKANPNDRRCKLIHPTTAGKKIIHDIEKHAYTLNSTITKRLAKADIDILEKTLTQLKSNLKDTL